jgi:hypothetical protein
LELQDYDEDRELDAFYASRRLLMVFMLAVGLVAGHQELVKWLKKPQREAIATCLKMCSNDEGKSCEFDDLKNVFSSDEDARKKVGVAWCAREILEEKIKDDRSDDGRDFRLTSGLLDMTHTDVETVMDDMDLEVDW